MILDDIVAYKRKKVAQQKREVCLKHIISEIKLMDGCRDFMKALKKPQGLAIIGEIKKASPSKGIIVEDFCPEHIARQYNSGLVEAISVLTEDKFFKGKNSYLKAVKQVTRVPILRKDFLIDAYQIYEARALGADAILLIVAILSKEELLSFYNLARELGLQCLVEVHDEAEMQAAIDIEAQIIGINNRDLKLFKTSLENTEKLITQVPKNKIVISESGIKTRCHIKYLEALGVNGVLIGESLMTADSIEGKLRELRGM